MDYGVQLYIEFELNFYYEKHIHQFTEIADRIRNRKERVE